MALANGDALQAVDLDLTRAVLTPDLSAIRAMNPGGMSVVLLPRAVRQWRDELKASLDDAESAWPCVFRAGSRC